MSKLQSPEEIYKAIENIPSYRQEESLKDFEGLSIAGKGSFNCFDAFKAYMVFKPQDADLDCLSLWTVQMNGSLFYPLVYFMADPEKNPELKHIKKGQKITYEGKIKQTTATAIYIDVEKYDFVDETQDTEPHTFVQKKPVHSHNEGTLTGSYIRDIAVSGDLLVNSQKSDITAKDLKRIWYEKPLGMLLLTIVGGLILAFLVSQLGWN